MLQLVRLNSGFINVETSAPGVSCFDVAGASDEDQEPFGDVPLMQCLGVASLPSPPDDTGYAEGILIENVGGLPGIVVSAWDTRTFSIFGTLEAGDTVLHSTGPSKAAQVLCKERKRQVVAATVSSDGEPIIVMLDGTNDKLQLIGPGGKVIEMTKDHILLEFGACGIRISADGIHLRGAVTLGGMIVPPNTCMAVASPAVWAALNAALPSVPGVISGGQTPITPIMNALGGL